ncbi:YihY/virulence factor BrkB family protein [Micrococcus sp.]|uniref:YihY/virulence factor BrkB family protein n=1 Tax=Micrococcus sp. TaxID=1271 RepID=UPI002A913C82|nr:YihY/virulence factor BrkB family protein [Micrococcus sp.]MDY6056107.1 YihY/virulence factor BrkB family protein [Micrococcus sp.]
MRIHPVDATLEAARIDPEERTRRLEGVKLDGSGWKYALTRAFKEFGNDGGTDLAAKLTYFMVLSLAPALLAVFSLLTLLLANNRGTVDDLVVQLAANVPSDYQGVVTDVVNTLMDQAASGGGFIAAIIGILTAIWSASAYVRAFSRSVNKVYGYEEGRGFVRVTLNNLATTVLLLVGVVVVLISIALNRSLVDGFLAPIAEPLGLVGVVDFLSGTFLPIWDWVKWPFVIALMLLMIAALYFLTPNVKKPKVHVFGPGNVFALVGLVVAALVLSVYLSNFAGYSSYGAIGGVMALLFVLWIFNIVLLLGIEIDAEVERAKQLAAGMRSEEAVRLPPKDVDALVKKVEKQEELEQKGYELRATHEPSGAEAIAGRGSEERDGGSHAAGERARS